MVNGEQIVDLLAHKNPALSILQLGDSSKITATVLTALAGNHDHDTKRYSKYLVADINVADRQNGGSTSETSEEFVTTISLDPGLELSEQMLESPKFDLVVATADFKLSAEPLPFLRDIQAILQDGGVALLSHKSRASLSR